MGLVIGADKKPVAGMRVSIQDGRTGFATITTTNSDGAFSFKGLSTNQNYLLRIVPSSGRRVWKKVRIQPYGNDPLFILLGTPSAPG